MPFIDFEESNFTLGAGDNPNTNDMRACHAYDPSSNRSFIVGKVKLTKEELQKVIDSDGELYVGVRGAGWPPMIVTSFSPFTDWGSDSMIPVDKLTKDT